MVVAPADAYPYIQPMPQYEKKPDAMPAFVPAMGTFHGRVSREPEEINLQSGSFTKIGLVTGLLRVRLRERLRGHHYLVVLRHAAARYRTRHQQGRCRGGHRQHEARHLPDPATATIATIGPSGPSAHKVMQRKAAGGSNGAPRPAGNRRGGRRFQVGGTPPPEPQEAHTGPLQAADGYDDEAPF